MATVKRISPGSAAKVGMVVYGILGIVVGAFIAALSMIAGSGGGLVGATPQARMMGFGMGMGAIIMLPIVYAHIGAIGGAITAEHYNLAAGWGGGLEEDIS